MDTAETPGERAPPTQTAAAAAAPTGELDSSALVQETAAKVADVVGAAATTWALNRASSWWSSTGAVPAQQPVSSSDGADPGASAPLISQDTHGEAADTSALSAKAVGWAVSRASAWWNRSSTEVGAPASVEAPTTSGPPEAPRDPEQVVAPSAAEVATHVIVERTASDPQLAQDAGGSSALDVALEEDYFEPPEAVTAAAHPSLQALLERRREEPGPSFGATLLESERFPELVALVETLQGCQSRHGGERAARQFCHEEGLKKFEVGSARIFIRRGISGTTEVFCAGSETDYSGNPESFLDCWLCTNPSISLVPLSDAICAAEGVRVHSGFQQAYLGVAPVFLSALADLGVDAAAAAAASKPVPDDADRAPPTLVVSEAVPGSSRSFEAVMQELATAPASRGVDGSVSRADPATRSPSRSPRAMFSGGGDDKITVVGYSLGGAIATLTALDLAAHGATKVELIMFGSPRSGDIEFQRLFANRFPGLLESTARFVNAFDIVPHVPLNAQDSAADGSSERLWQNVEKAICAALPQDYLIGERCSYHHVVRSTQLDGLSASLGSITTRMASLGSCTSSSMGVSAVFPALMSLSSDLLQNHNLSTYVENVKNTAKPAWHVVASKLMGAQGVASAAASVMSLLPGLKTAASSALAAVPVEAMEALAIPALAATETAVEVAGGAVVADAVCVTGAGVGAGALTTAGAAASTYVFPAVQIFGIAASVYGCFHIAQKVERLAVCLRDCSVNAELSMVQLADDVARVSEEVAETNRHLEMRMADLAALIHHQRVDDFMVRVRAARQQLVDDLSLYTIRPSESRQQQAMQGARDLRRATGELLEIATQWLDSGDHSAQNVANILGVVLSGSHLAVLGTAVCEEEDAPLRAAQAVAHLSPVLGRFYWTYLESGDEPWRAGLEQERTRFLGLSLALMCQNVDGSSMLQRLNQPQTSQYSALAFNPEALEPRAELALQSQTTGAVEAARNVQPAARQWSLSRASANGSVESRFLAGIAHLVPVCGQAPDPATSASLWAEAASRGVDLVPAMRALRERGEVSSTAWVSLADAARNAHCVPLLQQVYDACLLPEAQADELRTWLRSEVSLDDLAIMPSTPSSSAVQQMSRALAHDTKGIEALLSRSRDIFQDVAELIKVATLHLGDTEQTAIEEVKMSLSRDLNALNEETRYLLFGGLVSAGKTTLVNALLLQHLPGLREEIKEDRGGRLNLMPTAYNENTRIVTEIELNPSITEIEIRLLECDFKDQLSGISMEAEDTEDVQSPDTANGFKVASGFPKVCAGEKPWRKLQKAIRDVCESEPPDTVMRRLHIRVPVPKNSLKNPISIIDTPGLDSPTVWRQIRTLVHAKAFLFVWVGSVDATTAFGLQGRRLVELYRSTGHPLPPVLVLTKWDRLKALPEFCEDPGALVEQVQRRLAQLRAGLLPPDDTVVPVVFARPKDIDELASALIFSWKGGGDDDCCGRWMLKRSITINAQTIYRGSVLLTAGDDDGRPVANAVEYLRSLDLPATVRFHTDEAEARLLLAATNAASASSLGGGAEQAQSAETLQTLWQTLLPLLTGLSEPMRISKRLHRIIWATQKVVNVLLKDDGQATVFEQNRDDLLETQQRVMESFRQRVDQYFIGLPKQVLRPEYVPAGCMPQVSLHTYQPPQGLTKQECATCLIPQFIKDAHETAKSETSHFKYVKTIATAAVERWQSKFCENMVRFEHDCTMPLLQRVNELMQIHGLVNHAEWEPSIRDLIASPLEAVGTGMVAGTLVGGYCGLLAQAVMGVGMGVGVGLGVLVAVGVASVLFEDSVLAKNMGVWTPEEAQMRAAQTVLDILNKPDFQEKAKAMVLTEFERRLGSCLDQLADLRDPSTSDKPEAKEALSIQLRVVELQRALGHWFENFVSDQVGRDPWLAEPPEDLREALEADVSKVGAAKGAIVTLRVPESDSDSDSAS